MATTSSPGRSKYVEFDEYIDFQLQKTRAGIKTNDIVTALAGVGTLFLAYLLIFVLFDHWVVDGGFSPVGRWLMLGGLLAACVAWIVWRVVLPARRHVTGLYAARAIETTEPGLKHTLLNLVDLRRSGKAVPEDIARAMEKRAAVTLSKTDVDSAVDRRPLMRLSYALLALVVICCLYSLFSPKKISASVWRALFPSSATAVDTAIKIDKVAVEYRGRQYDADATLPARSKPDVIVDLSYTGAAPEKVMLYYSTADDKFRDVPVPLKPDAKEPKRYRIRLTGESSRGILQNTTYRIEAGDAKAGPFQITVVRPPIATVNQVRYVYPKYMEREPKTQDGGHIETWEGTTVHVAAKTDQPVTDAWLVFTDTEDVSKPVAKSRMTISGGTGLSVTLKREIAFREDGSYPRFYHIECVGKNGFKDPRPALYGVTIRRDLPPVVELIDPQGTERDVPANTRVLPLLYKAHDPDFKLRFVTLRSELTRGGNAGGEPEPFDEQLFEGRQREVRAAHDWKLDGLRLKPGDTVKFRLEARDNKPPSGNRSFSRWVTLRIVEPVSKDEAQRQLQANRQRQKQLQKDQQQNQGDQQPGEQTKDEPPKGGNQGEKPKEQKGKNGQQKGMGKTNQNNGNKGKPKAGQGATGQQPPDQPQDGANDGRGQEKNPNGKPKNGAGGEKPKSDQELIQQALRDQKQNQQKHGNQKGRNETPGENPDGRKPDNANPNRQNGNSPDGGQQPQPMSKPGKTAGQERGTAKSPKKDKAGQDNAQKPEQKPNKTPGKKEGTSPKNGTKRKQDDQGGTGSAKQNTGGTKNGAKQKPNGGGTGSSATKPKSGMQDDTTGDNTNQPGSKDKPPKAGGGNSNRKTKDAEGGPRKNVKDDGGKVTQKKATGDERGMADPEKNPKANPTKAKNPEQIQRRKGTKPAIKKSTSSGAPKEPGTQNGSSNPKTANPKTTKQPVQENKDDRTTKPKDNAAAKAAKSTNKRPDPGNNELKGRGRRDGQKSKKPNAGENGTGTPNDQGAKGSQQQGAGDKTKQPGQRQKSNGTKRGNPTQQRGSGSTTRPSPQAGNKAGGQRSSQNRGKAGSAAKAGPMGGQGGNTPGNSGAVPDTVPRPNPNARNGLGGGNGVGRNSVNPPPDGPDPEQKDLNYGRRASNLVLNRMEDQAKRPNVSKKWLKDHGWTSREQALKEISRIRKRVNGKSADPQFEEFLKSIRDMKFQSQVTKRTGANVRKTTIKGESNTGSENVPRRLRDYYKAFQRSVNR